MKNIFFLIVAFVSHQCTIAQNVSDILENGKRIKSGNALFLRYNEKTKEIEYCIAPGKDDPKNPLKLIPLIDSTIFLSDAGTLPAYLLPLNPLNFIDSVEIKFITDPIDESAASALKTIIAQMGTIIPRAGAGTESAKVNKCDTLFKYIDKSIKLIQGKLENDRKIAIAAVFTRLKSLSFLEEKETVDSIAAIQLTINIIDDHYVNLKNQIDNLNDHIKTYDCASPELNYLLRNYFTNITNEFTKIKDEQKKRLNFLDSLMKMVTDAKKMASNGASVTGLKWCKPLKSIVFEKGKISIITITIMDAGYKLSNKNEIISTQAKVLVKRTIRGRLYKSTIKEVSVGTAFTIFQYNSYGTTLNGQNELVVASPTANYVRNINITTMVNWNFYRPHSELYPLWQLGVGINSGIPTILTGFGLRAGLDPKNRIRITCGAAFTWIKELDKLKVGDKVKGTDDIDKDLKFQFTWPSSPYISFQWNF